MPPIIDRLYKCMIRKKGREDLSVLEKRKRALTLPLPQAAKHQSTVNQVQSGFFVDLPPEIRTLIYHEVLRDRVDVIHVAKRLRKPLELKRCKEICAMKYNFRCWAEDARDAINILFDNGFLSLLRSCRRA